MKVRIRFPNRKRLLESRWLRPFAHRLGDVRLWHLNRESVARGLALGLFIGLVVPLGQTPLAALLAIPIRAHLLVAAGATFVTNPLTFPIIYFAALRWGETLLAPVRVTSAGSDVIAGAPQNMVERMVAVAGPLAAGLLFFAVFSAVVAYIGVKLGWRIRTAHRWNKRRWRKSPPSYRLGTNASPAPEGAHVRPACDVRDVN